MMKQRRLFLLPWFILAWTIPAFSQTFMEMSGLNPSTQYEHFETDHFEFDFQKGYLDFTREAAKHLEHAHTILSPILQWKPRSKIHVLVADNEDSANGFAMPSLRVGMVLIATPPDQWYSTSYSENWIKLLAFHEYVHILNIDPTSGWLEAMRIIFGDVIRPNGLWPRWALEGLAVYFETRTSILGRGRSPYYDAIVRSYFHENKLGNSHRGSIHYGTLSGEWPYFPGGEVPYLFGYHLWNQFGKTSGDEMKMGEYSIRSSGRVPFFIDGNLENTIGRNWQGIWNEYTSQATQRYENQIKEIEATGTTPHRILSDAHYSAIGGTISPDGQWLAYTEVRLDERSGLILKNLKTGKTKKIDDKLQGLSMSFTPDSKTLIFGALHRNTTFTLFSDLFALDLQSETIEAITDGMRAKDPDLSSDGKNLTFTVTERGTHVLKSAQLEKKNGRWTLEQIQTIYQPKAFTIIGNPRWMNSEEIVFSEQKLGEAEAKILKIRNQMEAKPATVIANGSINRFPIRCGKRMLHVSDQSGMDLVYENRTVLTQVVTAVQFPFCGPDGTLYGSILTSNGFEIAQFGESDQNISETGEKKAIADAPSSIPEAIQSPELKTTTLEISNYSPLRTLAPRQWAPFAYYDVDNFTGSTAGGLLLGFDISGRHQYVSTFAYNFKSKTMDGTLDYTYYGFRPSIDFGIASYTNDIGVDDQFKRTHEAGIELNHLTRWTWSSLKVAPYALVKWNSLWNITGQNRAVSEDLEFKIPNIPVAGLKTVFSDIKNSRLGFMPEGGSILTTETQARIYSEQFTLWKFMTEYTRFISPGSHHVIQPKFRFLGSSHPYGQERSYAILSGRTKGNLFDRGKGFSLSKMQIRGYSSRPILTKSSYLTSVDYHFPIDTFFSGKGPTFLQQLHGFIFGEATLIPSRKFKDPILPSFGLGITADTTVLWNVPVSVSAEMHYGTNKTFNGEQAFFISVETSVL